MVNENKCCLCKQEEETIEHYFVHLLQKHLVCLTLIRETNISISMTVIKYWGTVNTWMISLCF